ncbi:MAG: hypothetical protein CSA70_02880 [Rhodobacterales bacterium]|nr:MAG: hypothetical protein CSA70_02880 [Rhodobacterales bacterium]
MRILLLFVLAALPTATLSTPLTLDGSEAALEKGTLGRVNIALANMGVRDPLSAQHHSLSYNQTVGDATHLCGHIKPKTSCQNPDSRGVGRTRETHKCRAAFALFPVSGERANALETDMVPMWGSNRSR